MFFLYLSSGKVSETSLPLDGRYNLTDDYNRKRISFSEMQPQTPRQNTSFFKVSPSNSQSSSMHSCAISDNLNQILHPSENSSKISKHYSTTRESTTDKKVKQSSGIFNKGDNVRRSSRIATKSRPWPLRKAFSCTNAYDEEPSMWEPLEKSPDKNNIESVEPSVPARISEVQNSMDMSGSINDNHTFKETEQIPGMYCMSTSRKRSIIFL